MKDTKDQIIDDGDYLGTLLSENASAELKAVLEVLGCLQKNLESYCQITQAEQLIREENHELRVSLWPQVHEAIGILEDKPSWAQTFLSPLVQVSVTCAVLAVALAIGFSPSINLMAKLRPTINYTETLSPLEDFHAESVSAQIPEGYRAVSVVVESPNEVEAWSRSRNVVDVVWIRNGRDHKSATIIAQDLKVLGSARNRTFEDTADPTLSDVTLVASADDALRILLARADGELTVRDSNDAATLQVINDSQAPSESDGGLNAVKN